LDSPTSLFYSFVKKRIIRLHRFPQPLGRQWFQLGKNGLAVPERPSSRPFSLTSLYHNSLIFATPIYAKCKRAIRKIVILVKCQGDDNFALRRKYLILSKIGSIH